jgi:hypothetical protein
MKERIAAATLEALTMVRELRFFRTERGYHGRFYCALQQVLDSMGFLADDTILEMEYQKSQRRHGISQRPDIVLHSPTEATGKLVTANNIAVWALKHRASVSNAREDFTKLDEMIRVLHYQVIVFVNVESEHHYFNEYCGPYSSCLVTCSALFDSTKLRVTVASDSGGKTVTA